MKFLENVALYARKLIPVFSSVTGSSLGKSVVALASRVVGRFHGQFKLGHFDYEHPTRLQPGTVGSLRS